MRERTVGDIIGFPQISDEIGVEVEIEATNYCPKQDDVMPHWRKLHDGSLRGNYNAEYVFVSPLSSTEGYIAIDNLTKAIKTFKTKVIDSVRAGVHVHINVRDLNITQLWTCVTCYYILEELLTDWCGEGRQGNHFCLRVMDADFLLDLITGAIAADGLHGLETEDIRYAALNLNALFKFGTLEFRQLRTPQDFNKIKVWMGILLKIKKNSSLFMNPRSVIENFSLGGEEAFLNAMLEEDAKIFLKRNKDILMCLRRGSRIAQEIGYGKEW